MIHAFSLTPRSDDHEDHKHLKDEMDTPQNCHTHGGVEHCTGTSSEEITCARPDGSYNVRIRVGSLFIVFVTSSIAVFGPILLRRFAKNVSTTGIRFTMIKQFGTGVIIATALIHLLTHASLQFASECLGELDYEATTTAIVMAGAFMTFLVEFLGGRYIMHRRAQKAVEVAAAAAEVEAAVSVPASANGSSANSSVGGLEVEKAQNLRTQDDLEMSRRRPPPLVYHEGHGHDIVEGDDKLSVWVMEMGIIFHSICISPSPTLTPVITDNPEVIGITTVVSGDSAFRSLLIVIIFHQMFEGLALGSRISTLSTVSTLSKSIMATVFACITPLGMMIGIIVLKDFNGSDRTTILTLGTLDALSAGILIWVGFVEMWAGDWIHGDLKRAGMVKTAAAMGSLVAGMLLMALLGKWA